MNLRYCPRCAARLRRGSTRGGIPTTYCPKCDDDSPYLAPDGGHEPISDLTAPREGDCVLWDGRERPLTVVRTTFGSHVIAEGPDGALYRILPDHREGRPAFRLARGGSVRRFRRGGSGHELLADGESAPVDVVAEKAGVSERTVYRAAENNPRLLRVRDRVAGFVTDVVRRAIGSIRERGGGLLDRLRSDASETSGGSDAVGEDPHRSSFIEKLAEWGVMWDDEYPNKPQFDLGRLPRGVDPKDVMDDLYMAWCQAGRDREAFHRASFEWEKDGVSGHQPRYKARP